MPKWLVILNRQSGHRIALEEDPEDPAGYMAQQIAEGNTADIVEAPTEESAIKKGGGCPTCEKVFGIRGPER